MPKTRAEMMEMVRNLVAEYCEFQRRQPDVPQDNLWGLSQDELERLVTAFQFERESDTSVSDPAPPLGKTQIH
jgi:hypothetical protein